MFKLIFFINFNLADDIKPYADFKLEDQTRFLIKIVM